MKVSRVNLVRAALLVSLSFSFAIAAVSPAIAQHGHGGGHGGGHAGGHGGGHMGGHIGGAPGGLRIGGGIGGPSFGGSNFGGGIRVGGGGISVGGAGIGGGGSGGRGVRIGGGGPSIGVGVGTGAGRIATPSINTGRIHAPATGLTAPGHLNTGTSRIHTPLNVPPGIGNVTVPRNQGSAVIATGRNAGISVSHVRNLSPSVAGSIFYGNNSPFGAGGNLQAGHHHHHGHRYPTYVGGGIGFGWGWPYGFGIGFGSPYYSPFYSPYYSPFYSPFYSGRSVYGTLGVGVGGYGRFSYSSYYPLSSYNFYGPTTIAGANNPMITELPVDLVPPAGEAPPAPDKDLADDRPAATNDSLEFAAQGERQFQAGRYDEALKSFQHALVEAPDDGATVLLLAQALFQTGRYDEAAGALQHAAQVVPEEKWGAVGAARRKLYTNINDYAKRLRDLEREIREQPASPGLHFLLGWHYAFINYPREAITELDKAIELAPDDAVAVRLRDMMQERVSGAKKQPEPILPP